MSNEAVDRQAQKINEFMRLLPLTIELAGMPKSEVGRYYNEAQIEVRGNTLRTAYKVARQVILDIAK
jgi:hypothetical protein